MSPDRNHRRRGGAHPDAVATTRTGGDRPYDGVRARSARRRGPVQGKGCSPRSGAPSSSTRRTTRPTGPPR